MPKTSTKSNAKRYEQQWDVSSDSDPTAYYTVSLTREGQLICHCWPFLRNRECKHVRRVQAGEIAPRGQTVAAPPWMTPVSSTAIAVSKLRLVLANVRCVTPVADKAEAEISAVKVPPLPLGNEHFLLTVLYDLLQLGVAWSALQKRFKVPREITPEWVTYYIAEYGRLIYGPLQEGRFQGWEYIPPEGV
ncbi:hypothetical protein TFLX_06085 [Thermoflexales bacterium]|nr:hypothetical protein TFLX_06085 [Thermoflexales bacterium]